MTSQTFTTVGQGTFKVPVNVTSITVEAWGAGGGGSGSAGVDPAGGGGGGYSLAVLSVNDGQTVFFNVGNGGTGATNLGQNGGTSWVNPSANSQPVSNGVVAAGGSASSNGNASGGAGSVGTTNFTGGAGAHVNGGGGGGAGSAGNGGNGVAAGGAGGAGGSPDGGAGGAGAANNPVNGTAPGGGGGGSANASGANGANGQVKITWVDTPDPLLKTTLTKDGKYFSRKDYIKAIEDFRSHDAAERAAAAKILADIETERNLTDIERADRDFNNAEEEFGQSEEALFNNLTSTNHIKFSEAKEKRDRTRKDRDHHYYMDVVKKAWAEFNETKAKRR